MKLKMSDIKDIFTEYRESILKLNSLCLGFIYVPSAWFSVKKVFNETKSF